MKIETSRESEKNGEPNGQQLGRKLTGRLFLSWAVSYLSGFRGGERLRTVS